MSTITIEDGKHHARLVALTTGRSQSGNPYVQFQWQLTDGRRIYSASYLNRKDGSRNERGIANMQKWAKEWDGKDIGWFERELERLKEMTVELVVKNKPWFRDPAQTSPQVEFINPVNAAETPVKAVERVTVPTGRTFALGEVAPNMLDAWRAFQEQTTELSSYERDLIWIEAVNKAAPNKDQDLFTDEDWEKVIHILKGE